MYVLVRASVLTGVLYYALREAGSVLQVTLHLIGIDRSAQQCGLGRRCLEEFMSKVKQEARLKAVSRVEISTVVNQKNSASQALLTRFGFTHTGRVSDHPYLGTWALVGESAA
ncbi:GNAT family N-acetyltransferase [Nesterenkonia cremea]